jgi:hypothetical protein
VEDADLINYAYAYDGFGSTQVSRPKKKSSDFLKNITKAWDDYENGRRNQNKKSVGEKISLSALRMDEPVGHESFDINESSGG